jgi:signal transduction histidine kinase
MSATIIAVIATTLAALALVQWRLAVRRYAASISGLRLALEGRSRHESGPAPSIPSDVILLLRDVRQLASQSEAMKPESYRSRLYERLLDQLRQGVIIVTPGLQITLGNRAVSKLFPCYTGQPRISLAAALREPRIEALVREAAEMQTWRSTQIRTPALGGLTTSHERVLAIEAAPLPIAQGQGVWLIIEDITERVMTEQIRKDFVTNASHELRTPLTLIIGYVETLLDGLLDKPEAARRSLTVMEKHGHRLLRLVEDMLTISRLESSDELALRSEPFIMEDCVREVLVHLTPLIEARQPRIEIDFPPPDIGVVCGDRFYWDQIFFNLIENALKENPRGGLHLRIAGHWQQAQCVLTVSDDGLGIPAADVPFVFNRFYRAAKHNSSAIKGTGLGLSIVKRAISAHQGTVQLSSIPGVSTVFTIQIPVAMLEA